MFLKQNVTSLEEIKSWIAMTTGKHDMQFVLKKSSDDFCYDKHGNIIPCHEGYEQFNGPTSINVHFNNGQAVAYTIEEEHYTIITPNEIITNIKSFTQLSLAVTKYTASNIPKSAFQIGRIDYGFQTSFGPGNPSPQPVRGNVYSTKALKTQANLIKGAKIGGNVLALIQTGNDIVDIATTTGHEQELAIQKGSSNAFLTSVAYYHPLTGVIITSGLLLSKTELYQKELQKALIRKNYDPVATPLSKIDYFKPHDGLIRNEFGQVIGSLDSDDF